MQVVLINYKEDRKIFRKLSQQFGDKLLITHDRRGSIGKTFNVQGLPNMFVIDQQGLLAYHNVGYGESSIEKIVGQLNQLIVEHSRAQESE